jgi:hypothetical protein
MSSFTIGGQAWPEGTVVNVYRAASLPAGATVPVGPTAAPAATVSGGSVTFTGLTENVRYVAYAGGVSRYFLVAPIDPTDTRSLRSRVDELAVSTGSTSGGGIAACVFNGSTWPARPAATVVHWIGGSPADDPFVMMANGDIWFPAQGSV